MRTTYFFTVQQFSCIAFLKKRIIFKDKNIFQSKQAFFNKLSRKWAFFCITLLGIKINCIFAVIMKKILITAGLRIQKMIDFTYPLFRKLISQKLYRYGVCGGANVLLDWILYFLAYNFIFKDRIVDLGFIAFSPHIAAFIIVFPVITLSGFLLQKYVTFTDATDLRGRVQLMRYILIVFANLFINYAGLKIFVDGLNFYPTPSKMIITVFTVICSYIGQKKFTFKVSQQPKVH